MTKLLNTAKKSGNNIMGLKLLIELAEITAVAIGAREIGCISLRKKNRFKKNITEVIAMTRNEMANIVILAGNTIVKNADNIVERFDNVPNFDNVSEVHLEVTIKGDKDEGFSMEISGNAEHGGSK